MNGKHEPDVLVETEWGTVMYERMPDGRRRACILKDDQYYKRIADSDTLGVAYTRFSSHGQNESTTEVQLEVIFAMASKNGTAIVEVYCDEGRSGTNDRRLRDGAGEETPRLRAFRMIAQTASEAQKSSHPRKDASQDGSESCRTHSIAE